MPRLVFPARIRAALAQAGLERDLAPVWLFNALIAAAAVVLVLGPVDAAPFVDAGTRVPWWTLAAVFGLAEVVSVHLPFRRESHTITFGDIPLVLGLFLVTPGELVAAQAIGAAVVLVLWQRQAPVKVAFNVVQKSLCAVLAVLTFHAVADLGDPLGAAGWAGALVAVLLADAVALVLVVGAMSIVRRTLALEGLGAVYLLGQATTLTNAALGLFAVVILVERPAAAWLVLFPGVTVITAYRALAQARNRRGRLEALRAAQHGLDGSLEQAASTLDLLRAAREVFTAGSAEITLLRPDGSGTPLRAAIDPADEVQPLAPVVLGPAEEALVEELTERGSVLLPRGRRHPYLTETGRADALVTVLRGDDAPLGYLVVADRLTEAASFTDDDVVAFEILAGHVAAMLHRGRAERALHRQRDLQQRLDHETLHDALTGLPNRVLFVDRVRVAAGGGGGGQTAVVLLDLDAFTRVNERGGHVAGDVVLRAAARQLGAAAGADETPARTGADEFAVLLRGVTSEAEAVAAAERLRLALTGRYATLDGDAHLTVSAGVAWSAPGADGDDVLRRAAVALDAARAAGGARTAPFEDAMLAAAVERGRLADDVAEAVAQGQLLPHYQPIVELSTGRLAAVEALVRWEHPTEGLLPPGRFLPHVEDTPLILEIGRGVLRRACRDAAAWRAGFAEHAELRVTVNAAARQLAEPSFVQDVEAALAESGLPPGALTIEITETAAMRDIAATRERLAGLRMLGVLVALDDFGTGHSSFEYLKRLDVDAIKIAKPFIDCLGQNRADDAFAATLVRLGELRGLVVVAEGIEEPHQASRLRDMGCGYGQGYLFSRPLDASALAGLLAGRRAA